MDREGQDPFDLLDELEEKLNIKVRPLSWPIGIGATFKGVYNLYEKNLNLFNPSKTKIEREIVFIRDLNDPALKDQVGEEPAEKLKSDVDLIEGVYEPFSTQPYLDGNLAPVFFGIE